MSFGCPSGASDIVAAELNGDTRQDFIVCAGTAGAAAVFIGNGNGTFGSASFSEIGSNTGPRVVTLGDVNGDGNQDAVVGHSIGSVVSVHLGTGTGTFSPRIDVPVGGSSYAVSLADLGGDGKLDLVVTNDLLHTVSTLPGNGNGTFGTRTDYSTSPDSPTALAVSDLNGDGKLDLAVATGGTASIYLNAGSGTFGSRNQYFVGSGDPARRFT